MEGKKVKLACLGMLLAGAVMGNALNFSRPYPRRSIPIDSMRLGVPFKTLPMDSGFLATLGAKKTCFRSYRSQSTKPVWLFIGYFDRQRQGSQVHSPQHCYPGSGWNVLSSAVGLGPGGKGRMGKLLVTDGRSYRQVLYWYQTEEGMMASVFRLKLDMIRRALTFRPTEVVFVRLSRQATPGQEDWSELERFGALVAREVDRLYRERSRGLENP